MDNNKQNIFIVPENCQGIRLDAFLTKKMPDFSRTKIRSLITKNLILVNDTIKKPSFFLRPKQKVCILHIPEEKNTLESYNFPVKIIYEDNDIMVVDKPSGLTVHPPQKNYNRTLVNALLYQQKTLSSIDP